MTPERMTELNFCDYLTLDQVLALPDDELPHYWRRIQREHLAHLREMLEPIGTPYFDNENEPHGLWSDDGHDYLQAALDLAQLLIEFDPDDTEGYRALLTDWASTSDHDADYAEQTEAGVKTYDMPPMPNLIYRFATDGIPSILYALIPDEED